MVTLIKMSSFSNKKSGQRGEGHTLHKTPDRIYWWFSKAIPEFVTYTY